MKICIFHSRMGVELHGAVRAAYPDLDVEVVTETDRDPPNLDEIEVLVANALPPGLLGRCRKLRWLQLTGAGYDHVPAGNPRPTLVVTHAGSVPARAVAEFVWMSILALAKDAPMLVQRQLAHVWAPPDSRLVAGSTLVIAGLGSIGREVALRAPGFGVRTVALTRSGQPSPLVGEVRPSSMLPEALRDADHLVIALPVTPFTARPLFGEAEIRALPSAATLINVGRAAVLDTQAVVRALREGRLRSAVLDVHDQEPLPPDSPLWDVKGLWVTPHGAFRYPGEAAELAALVVDNLSRYRAGLPLRNVAELSSLASSGR